MNQKYITALYLRISDEDEELNKSRESESISGQRLMLMDFVRGQEQLSSSTIIEVIDDGFSGTNFDRPGVKKLLEMAKARQVDCIVVKDFSRFGRNYLEVGNYLEQIFPFLGVRFLSVNDQFDSFENIGAAGSIEVGFKNILHQAYSKDLSEKIRSARRLKAEEGQFVSAFAPYGFRKAQDHKNQLVVDAECAAIVRRIFDLSLGGMGKTAIARRLNQERIPSPMMVRKQRNENNYRIGCNDQSHWTVSTVSQILSDQRYVGDAVYGKVAPKEVGSKKSIQVPRENWVIVPDAHPSIIERDKFEAVQAGKSKRNYQRTKEKPLAKKIICRACNHALHRISKGKGARFQCATRRNTHRYPCFTGHLPESELEAVILAYLQWLVLSIQEHHVKTKSMEELTAIFSKKWKGAQGEMTKKQSDAFALYQRFKAGKITQAAFVKKTAALEGELALLAEQAKQYERDHKKAAQGKGSVVSAEGVHPRHIPFQQLTKEAVDEFVEVVYAEMDGTISITWSFRDPFLPRQEGSAF